MTQVSTSLARASEQIDAIAEWLESVDCVTVHRDIEAARVDHLESGKIRYHYEDGCVTWTFPTDELAMDFMLRFG